MTTRRITLDRLEQIAHAGRHTITVDATRRIAYLRRGQTKYVAPLAEEVA
jgi:hypothetical protein